MSQSDCCANKPADKVDLSIVIPAFNEATNVRRLYCELVEVLSRLNVSWEIIFADDGSVDTTWDEIKSLNNDNKNVKGIRLSRNFGHQYALLAGMTHAAGQAVISMDADLQHPPQLIPELVSEWRKGSKIVHTIRRHSADTGLFRRWTSKLYYRVFSLLSGVPIEEGMADFRLLDRQVLDAIRVFREGGLFWRGIVQWVGYPSSKVTFQGRNRHSGKTKYTLSKMIRLAASGITSFSVVPLRIGVLLGVITSLLAFAELAFAVYAKLVLGTTVPGWASAVSVVAFLFGILFILLGLIGEYIGQVLIEVRGRPRFIVGDTIGFQG